MNADAGGQDGTGVPARPPGRAGQGPTPLRRGPRTPGGRGAASHRCCHLLRLMPEGVPPPRRWSSSLQPRPESGRGSGCPLCLRVSWVHGHLVGGNLVAMKAEPSREGVLSAIWRFTQAHLHSSWAQAPSKATRGCLPPLTHRPSWHRALQPPSEGRSQLPRRHTEGPPPSPHCILESSFRGLCSEGAKIQVCKPPPPCPRTRPPFTAKGKGCLSLGTQKGEHK